MSKKKPAPALDHKVLIAVIVVAALYGFFRVTEIVVNSVMLRFEITAISAGAVKTIIAFGFLLAAPLLSRLLSIGHIDPDKDAVPCSECGYDLRGSVGPRCSECGADIETSIVVICESCHGSAQFPHSQQGTRQPCPACGIESDVPIIGPTSDRNWQPRSERQDR